MKLDNNRDSTEKLIKTPQNSFVKFLKVIKPTKRNFALWFFVIIVILCVIGKIISVFNPEYHFFDPILAIINGILFLFGTSLTEINPHLPVILRNLAEGVVLTLYISVISVVIGFFIALLLAVILVHKTNLIVVKPIAKIYVNFFRSTPLLVQILLIFYGLPTLMPNINDILGNLNISIAVFSGVVALSLNTAAYQAEILRSGIMAIPSGQTEAARALGMTHGQTMRFIILPQAIRLIVPPLTNEVINIILNSSLLSSIGVYELTKASRTLQSYYFMWEILLYAAVFYFVLSYSLSKLTKIIEEKYRIPGLGVAHE
jgi:glutamine transport system permease protein